MLRNETSTITTTRSPDAPGGFAGIEPGLLRRTEKTSLIAGVILAIPFATYWGAGAGCAWLAGMAWSLVNIRFIAAIIREVLTLEERDAGRIVPKLVLKFPILYVVGFFLLRFAFLPTIWLVAGFTWPFFVLFMKGAGRAYMKLDQSHDQDAEGSTQPR